MIRVSTCIIAALAFLGALFTVDCLALLLFGWRLFGSIPLVVCGYLLGLLRMRAMANQGRQAEDDDLRRTIAAWAIAALPISKAEWIRRRGKWSE
jgi:hypothetical protein